MKPADIPRALRLAANILGQEDTTEREDVLAAALVTVSKKLDERRQALALDGGPELLAAVRALPAADARALAALLALGTPDELAAKLSAQRDYEKPGARHPLTSTTAAQWLDRTALDLWRLLGRGRP